MLTKQEHNLVGKFENSERKILTADLNISRINNDNDNTTVLSIFPCIVSTIQWILLWLYERRTLAGGQWPIIWFHYIFYTDDVRITTLYGAHCLGSIRVLRPIWCLLFIFLFYFFHRFLLLFISSFQNKFLKTFGYCAGLFCAARTIFVLYFDHGLHLKCTYLHFVIANNSSTIFI